jgi:peroxiredoxin
MTSREVDLSGPTGDGLPAPAMMKTPRFLPVMNRKLLLIVAIAVLWSGNLSAAVAAAGDADAELKALVTKIRADVHAGKRTEAALTNDLKQFDVLLAKHKGEKTDAAARVLFMKAMLYAEVLHNPAKADQLMKQLKSEYANTPLVARYMQMEAKQKAAQLIQQRLVVGAPFPDFSEKDVTGKPLALANYKGKVVLIDFWATWCSPCLNETTNLVATSQKFRRQGFEIIGVNLDKDRQKMLAYTKQMNMTWPQFFDGQGLNNKLVVKYGVEHLPANFLLDGSGKIIGLDLRGPALQNAVARAYAKK